MMLDRFHPGQLPDGKPVLPQNTDISTYRKVYAAAKAIEKQCTEVRYPGWATIGEHSDTFHLHLDTDLLSRC